MTGTLRSFVAIGLPEAIADDLAALQEGLDAGREVPAENLHLTLAFLGDQTGPALAAADQALTAVRGPAFELQLQGLDLMGGRAPRLLFAGVRPCPDLDALERRVGTALRQAGVSFEKRRFRPHVTIARFGRAPGPGERARIGAFLARAGLYRSAPFRVDGFALYRSRLTPGGAVYEELAAYPLGD